MSNDFYHSQHFLTRQTLRRKERRMNRKAGLSYTLLAVANWQAAQNLHARCNYRNRICRSYHGGLPGVYRAFGFVPGYGRSQNSRLYGRARFQSMSPISKTFSRKRSTESTFTSSYAEAIPGADVVFIAVGTPPTPSGAPNLEYLSQAARCDRPAREPAVSPSW